MPKKAKPARAPKPLKKPAAKPKPAARPRTGGGDDLATRRHLRQAVEAAVGKKAADPVLLDLRQRADFCDYMMLCHGGNPHQIQAIADAVEERLEAAGLRPAHREGGREGNWVVLDYIDFLVHIFSAQHRRFYDLERLWRDAPRLALPASVRGAVEGSAGESGAE